MVDSKVTDFPSAVSTDITVNDLLYLIAASGTSRDKQMTVQALRDAIVRLLNAGTIDWAKVSKSSANPSDVGADAAGTAAAAVATHAIATNPHSQLQSAINAKQDSNARLTAIASQVSPANPKIARLGTDGVVSFVDIGMREVLSPLATTWSLSATPAMPHLSNFYINGQRQTFGLDYVINGSSVTWQGYPLKAGWKIEIYYF